jgi:endo-1,4-beta-xylanase
MFTVPRLEPFRKFLKRISDLGLKIEITELDARLRLFGGHDDPYQAQGDFYEAFVPACLENPLCSGVTIWGLSDRHVWYDGLGVFKLHRPNESNLFDEKLSPKPAYQGLVNALTKG